MFTRKFRKSSTFIPAAFSILVLISFLIGFIFFNPTPNALVPELKDGRIHPRGYLEDGSNSAIIATKNGLPWKSLNDLPSMTHKETLYSKDAFAKFPVEKEKALLEAYHKELAGTVLQKAYKKSRKFPSIFQLKLELYLKIFPFFWMLVLSYFAGIFSRAFYAAAFSLHTLLLLSRMFILERPPVTNMFETVFFVPWVTACGGLIISFFQKNVSLEKLASAAAFFLTLVMTISYKEPRFDGLQAVLDQNMWLTVHVVLVVASYAFFTLSGLSGHIYLLLYMLKKNPPAYLEKAIMAAISLGVALLLPGTLLGGVWAAQSWGRFWDWDPKEAWAFITIALHLVIIHAYYFKRMAPFFIAFFAGIGFLAVIFTWYGVNYILGTGLHSYGFSEGGTKTLMIFLISDMIFLSTAYFGRLSIERKIKIM